MDYYKKYQPKSFNDIIGQKRIVDELRTRLENDNLPEVLFFIGPSGVGKTSMAKVLAASTNCENKTVDVPCGVCAACRETFGSGGNTIVYVDGSQTDKEKIGELVDIADTSFVLSKRLFIVIDEFQQLSNSARGAVLKLLEKPRKGVSFVLCSMDSNIDKAILSRGLIYKFSALPPKNIFEGLLRVIDGEGLDFEGREDLLVAISEYANGNLRYAMQILERVVCSNIKTVDDLAENFGIFSEQVARNFTLSILNKNLVAYEQLRKEPVERFFYLKKVLSDVSFLYRTKLPTDPWMEESNKIIYRHPGFELLWSMLEKSTKEDGSPKVREFLYYMGVFFSTKFPKSES